MTKTTLKGFRKSKPVAPYTVYFERDDEWVLYLHEVPQFSVTARGIQGLFNRGVQAVRVLTGNAAFELQPMWLVKSLRT